MTISAYLIAKAEADRLDSEWKAASAILNQFPKGPMGLTPDAVRATPEWQAAKIRCETCRVHAQRFNAWYVKAFKRERASARQELIAERMGTVPKAPVQQ